MVSKSIIFNLELQRNILKFGYGINYKYEGMLVHLFDRFYIVTNFMLPSMGDIKFSKLNFDHSCTYMNKEYAPNMDLRKYLTELKAYCNKINPFVSHYTNLIKSYNATVYNILENEIKPLLPRLSRQKCGIITTLVSGFIGLAYEGISGFLQQKHENALQKAVLVMDNQADIQHNKLIKLDITMLMYRIYNAETLEKLINTVQEIHNVTSSHEKLFAGEQNPTIFRLLYMDALGIQQYAFNSLLFLRVVQDKYISLYKELITQLRSYVSAIRMLMKGYLPTTLITLNKLQEILAQCKKLLQHTNLDFALVLERLHLYYNMQLVTFGIDRDMNLVIQFPVFIQPYIQKPLILYQLETVQVLILDANTDNFVVKHKSSYSCESAIYFNLTTDIIRNNCNFDFYYNNLNNYNNTSYLLVL